MRHELELQLRQEISDIVDRYEKRYGSICEGCGAPANLRTDLAWVLTLCDSCYEKRLDELQKIDERKMKG